MRKTIATALAGALLASVFTILPAAAHHVNVECETIVYDDWAYKIQQGNGWSGTHTTDTTVEPGDYRIKFRNQFGPGYRYQDITVPACPDPQPDPEADISVTRAVVCQDPRLMLRLRNDGNAPGTVTLRFVSGNRKAGFPVRNVTLTVTAGQKRDVTRWAKGGTVAIVRDSDGDRISTVKVNRSTNRGTCPVW